MIKSVLGVDPGKNIGIARFDVEDKKILHQWDKTVAWDTFVLILDAITESARSTRENDPLTIVVEDFRLFSHKAKDQIGSRMEAAQVIGAIKYVVGASKGRIEMVLQQASLNTTAAKWSGRGVDVVEKKGHLPDNVSASNHAHYWLVKNGFLKHRILDGR